MKTSQSKVGYVSMAAGLASLLPQLAINIAPLIATYLLASYQI